jgi:hypothetical protein
MTLKPSPLHFNPLRPSRNQLTPVSWAEKPAQRSTDRSPFAYLHQPFTGDNVHATAPAPAPEMGQYNRATQRWEFPEDLPAMGVWTKSRSGSPKSPPTASYPGESPDYDYVTDDACA